MGTPTLLSACLVLYHPSEEVIDTVRCLMNAPMPIDLYLVDNSPEDGMGKRLMELCPWAHYLPQEKNLGFGRGNNVVLPLLKSRFHLLINPDITFDPTVLTRMTAYMTAHPDTIILTPRVLHPDGSEQFLPKHQPTVRYLLGGRLEKLGRPFSTWRKAYTLSEEEIVSPVEVGFATGCFLLIRTHVFVQQLHGFDPRFFLYQEDSDLSRRASRLGAITYHPDMVVTHKWARENTKTLRGNLRQVSSIVKFFLKWGIKW